LSCTVRLPNYSAHARSQRIRGGALPVFEQLRSSRSSAVLIHKDTFFEKNFNFFENFVRQIPEKDGEGSYCR